MENENSIRNRLLSLTALSTDYCVTLENAADYEKDEFVRAMINYLPRLYWEFSDIGLEDAVSLGYGMMSDYVDEDYYDSVRRRLEMLFGEDDTFLETFEEDMKYSETPIAASIAESLADIFQPLFNFVTAVRESEGNQLEEAFVECRESFDEYWSQTLCNVMRPLNALRVKS